MLHITQMSTENRIQYHATYGFYHPTLDLISIREKKSMLLCVKVLIERIYQVYRCDTPYRIFLDQNKNACYVFNRRTLSFLWQTSGLSTAWILTKTACRYCVLACVCPSLPYKIRSLFMLPPGHKKNILQLWMHSPV